MTTLQSPAHVSVHLTDCAERDAHTVFGTLCACFPDRTDGAAHTSHAHKPEHVTNPMIWSATFDVRILCPESEAPGPTELRGPVTADLYGTDRPVHQVLDALEHSFRVDHERFVPGDQEVEVEVNSVKLLLTSIL